MSGLEVPPLTSTTPSPSINSSGTTFRCTDIDVAKRSLRRIHQGAPEASVLELQLLRASNEVLAVIHTVAIDHLLSDVASMSIHCNRDWVRKRARAVEVIGRCRGNV